MAEVKFLMMANLKEEGFYCTFWTSGLFVCCRLAAYHHHSDV